MRVYITLVDIISDNLYIFCECNLNLTRYLEIAIKQHESIKKNHYSSFALSSNL